MLPVRKVTHKAVLLYVFVKCDWILENCTKKSVCLYEVQVWTLFPSSDPQKVKHLLLMYPSSLILSVISVYICIDHKIG